ncbi:MAG: M20/M25/M40 family metallo-hydrolase, partial [Burkholderiales bacterium]|nr:M20/M25/M40 family metallo-hydrolase [Burkholderiales bacterium]
VSGDAKEENACAQFIYDYLSYIKPVSGTLTVKQINCDKDDLGRKAVLALYRTPLKTDRTVLLTGHFDVVSAEVYGKLKDIAFDPELCTKEISSLALPPSVRADLESGNWLFGRGTMDMKYGLATFMLAINAAATEADVPVNILFLAVPDEEGNSAGMRGALPAFEKFISEEKLNVVAGLSGEPCFITTNAQDEEVRPYWTGTIGKIMPFVFCIGKESHVNDYFQGFNAALLCAWVVESLEGAKDFLKADAQYQFPPPACLYMATLRKEYSVTLPSKAVAYFNVLTANATIEEILKRTTDVVSSRV